MSKQYIVEAYQEVNQNGYMLDEGIWDRIKERFADIQADRVAKKIARGEDPKESYFSKLGKNLKYNLGFMNPEERLQHFYGSEAEKYAKKHADYQKELAAAEKAKARRKAITAQEKQKRLTGKLTQDLDKGSKSQNDPALQFKPGVQTNIPHSQEDLLAAQAQKAATSKTAQNLPQPSPFATSAKELGPESLADLRSLAGAKSTIQTPAQEKGSEIAKGMNQPAATVKAKAQPLALDKSSAPAISGSVVPFSAVPDTTKTIQDLPTIQKNINKTSQPNIKNITKQATRTIFNKGLITPGLILNKNPHTEPTRPKPVGYEGFPTIKPGNLTADPLARLRAKFPKKEDIDFNYLKNQISLMEQDNKHVFLDFNDQENLDLFARRFAMR